MTGSPGNYRSEREAVEILEEVEQRFDLFALRYGAYSAWRLLRMAVALRLQNLPMPVAAPAASDRWRRTQILLRKSLVDTIRWRFLPRRQHCVLSLRLFFQRGDDGVLDDLFFDDVLRGTASFLRIDASDVLSGLEDGERTRLPVHLATRTLDGLASVLLRTCQPSPAARDVARQIHALLEHDARFDWLTGEFVLEQLHVFNIRRKLFRLVFQHLRPHCVWIPDGAMFSVAAAARETGARVVEFQHGVYTRYHPDCLPRHALRYRQSVLARDRMFLFGEHWRDQIASAGFYGPELRVVGSPRIDRFRAKRHEVRARRRDGVFRMVATLQNIDTEPLLRFMGDVVRGVSAHRPVQLTVKLHPAQQTPIATCQSWLGDAPGTIMSSGREAPATYDALAEADLHLSISSACHYDALGMGVPTVILPFANHETVQHLHEHGHAQFAASPAHLIKRILTDSSTEVPEAISARYYRADAVTNMTRELGEVVADAQRPD